MTAKILDGKSLAAQVRQNLRQEISDARLKPCLGVVVMGDDPASQVYVRNKQRACDEVGISTVEMRLPATASEDHLVKTICSLSEDRNVNGILVQLPLPPHIDKFRIFDSIDPEKDVDAFTAVNTGLMIQNRPRFHPCTPEAVHEILALSEIPIKGQNVVVINRSLIVGQPLAHMLMQNDNFANATVTVCHEFTKDMARTVRGADIVVTAVGRPDKFRLTADMVKPGSTVIDVAIIRQGKQVIGDAEFDEVKEVAGFITPVPGGVGPMTVAMLLKNTVTATRLQSQRRV